MVANSVPTVQESRFTPCVKKKVRFSDSSEGALETGAMVSFVATDEFCTEMVPNINEKPIFVFLIVVAGFYMSRVLHLPQKSQKKVSTDGNMIKKT